MRVASVKPNHLAVIQDDCFILIDEGLAEQGLLPKSPSMIDFITRYDSLKHSLESVIANGKEAQARLEPAQSSGRAALKDLGGGFQLQARHQRYQGRRRPRRDVEVYARAGPRNDFSETVFGRHRSGANDPDSQGGKSRVPRVGIVRHHWHGGEKRRQRQRSRSRFWLYCDARHDGARPNPPGTGVGSCRSVRKGFETFAPIGPWITTRDEIADPHHLTMNLWIDGELRQSANTGGMINGVAELVSFLLEVTTLLPGDLISTGNPDSPAFQRKLVAGEKLEAESKTSAR